MTDNPELEYWYGHVDKLEAKLTKVKIENAHLRGQVLAHTVDFNIVRDYIKKAKRTNQQVLDFLDKVEGK